MEEGIQNFYRGKKIIVTAGPVWVPIDKVRVMTNIFGGALGYEIAKQASVYGAKVVFVYGPGRVIFDKKERFEIIRFKYYDDIYKILEGRIRTKKNDIIIHSAAIPDYIPKIFRNTKIKSGKDNLCINFKKTMKIIDEFKKWDSNIFVVKFKLETDKTKKQLLDISLKSMLTSGSDMIVANELSEVGTNHRAYIINQTKKIIEAQGKSDIAKKLLKAVETNFKHIS